MSSEFLIDYGMWHRLSPDLLGGAPPAWVLRSGGVAATLDVDFVNDRAWNANALTTIASLLTCSRASTGYYTKADGTLTSFSSNVLRYGTNGLLAEEARTNVVLWNRDLTNAAWTASNCTVAKDQTGNDGSANSASSLTATAGNATVLQAITLASSARWQSAWVKRLTGSGTINMTMDNGSTWGTITVTSSWTLLSIATQTLANPTVGFRIVTSGDAIAVDFVQNEASGTFGTSPISTTTASATRAADSISFSTVSWLTPGSGTNYVQYNIANSGSGSCTLWDTDRTSSGEQARINMFRDSTNTAVNIKDDAASVVLNVSGATSLNASHKSAAAWANSSFALYTDGVQIGTAASGSAPTAYDRSFVGRDYTGGAGGAKRITRLASFNSRLANGALGTLTT